PTNVASGSTTNCYARYTVQSGDTCGAIIQSHNLALSDFLTWNPELNAQCTNLLLGESYCIFAQPSSSDPPVPTNAAPGSISPCHKWYTAVSGDSCFEIAQNEGCTVQDLMTWNPSLGTSCLVLIGVAYCVTA
ncbi:carbohydrate-binding module family 50 protein, partial [Sphaerobolus stellatus SS14]